MLITIKGGSSRQKKLVREMARWAGHKFFNKSVYDQITLHVKLFPLYEKDFYVGETFNIYKLARPKVFEVSVNNMLPTLEFKDTFMHELVHVKQYVKGHLVDFDEKQMCRFKGKLYRDTTDNENKIEYLYQPWEIEARGLVDALIAEFNHYKRMRGRK